LSPPLCTNSFFDVEIPSLIVLILGISALLLNSQEFNLLLGQFVAFVQSAHEINETQ